MTVLLFSILLVKSFIVFILLISAGGFETRIIRECGFVNTTINICQKIGMNDIGRQITCSCSEDGCNDSSQLKPETSILSLLVLGAFPLLYSFNVV